MNLLDAYQSLKKIEPLFSTKDAAAILAVSDNYAAAMLARLAKKNTIVRIARGRWAYTNTVDPLLLPAVLSYPMIAYVSLYTALYYHGMIEQIPSTIFAISNGKTKLYKTPLATISIHSINPVLFSDYASYGKTSILIATPEKALFDSLYLMPAKSHLFRRLTELVIPKKFDFRIFKKWLKLVENKSRCAMIENALYLISSKRSS